MLDRNELILEGLAYTVMGILVVFMILVIIMLVIKAMALLSGESKPKKEKQAVKQQSEKQQTSLVDQQASVVTQVAQTSDDSELIAVITAAIAAVMGKSTSGFVVRSYKTVSGDAWNKAGRMDILENRL